MGGFIGDALAKLAVRLLQWWAARQDIKTGERRKIALEAADLALKALATKADSEFDPNADPFKLRDDAGKIRVQGKDPPKTNT